MNKHPLDTKITDKNHEALRSYPLRKTQNSIQGVDIIRPWWLEREYLRMEHGVYPPCTEILQAINLQTPGFAVHPSRTTKELIAYTPDKSYGEADRQVHTTLARFITKYYPYYSDVQIAELQAEHLAELNVTYELLSGEAIVKAYRDKPGSSSLWACMSRAESSYTYGNPTVVYDTPGVFLALLRDKSGTVTARCLVYHASENDKRYIRATYGDAKLRKALERDGYKPGGWNGCKFKTVIIDSTDNRKTVIIDSTDNRKKVVVPYLDCNGSTATPAGSTVALIGGVLTGVSTQLSDKLVGLYGESAVGLASHTAGYMTLPDIDLSSAQGVCWLTGRAYNGLTDDLLSVYTPDGEKTCFAHAVKEACYRQVSYVTERLLYKKTYVSPGTKVFDYDYTTYLDTPTTRRQKGFKELSPEYYSGGWTREYTVMESGTNNIILSTDAVYYVEEDLRRVKHISHLVESPTFQYDGKTYVEGVAEREYCGMVKLDPVFYPDNQEWIRHGYVYTPDGKKILAVDSSRVWNGEITGVVHKSEITKKHVKLHNWGGESVWATPGATGVHKTPSGRKVVPDVHEVKEIGLTGTYEFKRNLKPYRVGPMTIWLPNGERPTAALTDQVYRRSIDEAMQVHGNNIHKALVSLVSTCTDRYLVIGDKYLYQVLNTATWPMVWRVMPDYHKRQTMVSAINRYYEAFMAEANAVDYNREFVGPPTPTGLVYEPVATSWLTVAQEASVETTAAWATTATTSTAWTATTTTATY